MKEKELYKCDICGDYHSEDKMEVVFIKLKKCIDCDMSKHKIINKPIEKIEDISKKEISTEEVVNYEPGKVAIPANEIPDNFDKSKNFSFKPVKRKNAVTVDPYYSSATIPPDHELNEKYGAKERRYK